MVSDNPRQDIPAERIDADAVCARCGTVNPEDTLLCKICGNNLRDQRAERVSRGGPVEGPLFESERRSWVGKGLSIFGILVILWVALNLGRIEEIFVDMQNPALTSVKMRWTGSESVVFDGLLRELTSRPITQGESDLAVQQPVNSDSYSGRYVITINGGGDRQTTIGHASVLQEGDRIRYVAVLIRGNIEVRGEARLENGARLISRNRDSAGLKENNTYYTAVGYAQKLDTGGLQCYGQSDLSERSYSFMAFRVP